MAKLPIFRKMMVRHPSCIGHPLMDTPSPDRIVSLLPAATEIYTPVNTLALHDALPISANRATGIAGSVPSAIGFDA